MWGNICITTHMCVIEKGYLWRVGKGMVRPELLWCNHTKSNNCKGDSRADCSFGQVKEGFRTAPRGVLEQRQDLRLREAIWRFLYKHDLSQSAALYSWLPLTAVLPDALFPFQNSRVLAFFWLTSYTETSSAPASKALHDRVLIISNSTVFTPIRGYFETGFTSQNMSTIRIYDISLHN